MEKGGRTVIQMMKIQLRLKEKRLRNLLFFGLGFFFLGLTICTVMTGKTREDAVNLGSLLALLVMSFWFLFDNLYSLPRAFLDAVYFGRTRKSFLVSYCVSECGVACTGALFLVLLHALEGWLYRISFHEVGNLELLEDFFRPVVLLWGAVVLTAAGILFGVLMVRFGQKAYWILWALWMFVCFVLPKAAALKETDPDGPARKAAILAWRILEALPPAGWMGMLVLFLAAGMAWSFRELMRMSV